MLIIAPYNGTKHLQVIYFFSKWHDADTLQFYHCTVYVWWIKKVKVEICEHPVIQTRPRFLHEFVLCRMFSTPQPEPLPCIVSKACSRSHKLSMSRGKVIDDLWQKTRWIHHIKTSSRHQIPDLFLKPINRLGNFRICEMSMFADTHRT
jgi:hypothetical protein